MKCPILPLQTIVLSYDRDGTGAAYNVETEEIPRDCMLHVCAMWNHEKQCCALRRDG